MHKILIIRLSSLGDIIHTYPMIYDIKSNFPSSKIDWLVDENFVELVKLNPLIDNVISIPLRNWKKNKLKFVLNFKKWHNHVNKDYYDYIIDSQGLIKSALLAKCFNGPIYGFGINSIREKIASFLYKNNYEVGNNLLAVNKNRLLSSAIFNYKIDIKSINFGIDNIQYEKLDLNIDRPYVVFFHGTSKDSKKLSVDDWIKLGNYLINRHGLNIILPYGNEYEQIESVKIREMINSPKVFVPDNRFNFKAIFQLINNSEFIFGVDTGLIHLANALNKKLIAIYVDTNPEKTGIFESKTAKNIGNKNKKPSIEQLITLYEIIMRN